MTGNASAVGAGRLILARSRTPGRGAPIPDPATPLAARAAWTLGGLTLIWWALLLYQQSDIYPWLALAVIAAGLVGLASIAGSWTAREGCPPLLLEWLAIVGAAALFLTWCWLQVRVSPGYGTDEIAFNQYAAQLFAHGHNPYAHSMAPSLALFQVDPTHYTYKLNGAPVTSLSYPSLSFLPYVPFTILGWTTQMAVAVNVAAWAVGMVLAALLLPRHVRPLASVLGSLPLYTGLALGGVTDALYVPLLVLAAYRWDRYDRHTGWHRWRLPIALGLATSVKQTPWLVLGYIALAFLLEARPGTKRGTSLRVALGLVARTLGVFMVVNAPFFLMDPPSWMSGVLAPILSQTIPQGQGWVALSDFLGVGGGTLHAYTDLVVAALVCSIVIFIIGYPRTKPLVFIMPSIVLFFAARSFVSYLVMLTLPALVSACSIRRPEAGPRASAARIAGRVRRWAMLAGALGLLCGSFLVALADPPPVDIRIGGVTTSGELATVTRVAVVVTNRSGHTITPVFSVQSGGELMGVWPIVRGPIRLGPNGSARYLIAAPNMFAQPSLDGGFQVAVLTTSPPALSTSAPYLPALLRVRLNPYAVNEAVPVGRRIVFRAQVVDRFDRPVRQAGIPVYLGQITYAQSGLVFSRAIIGRAPPGATPVVARTNGQGLASFAVVGTEAALDPVYFQANLAKPAPGHYPYGYSEIVPVRFTSTRSGS